MSTREHRGWRISVDTGGTFTDVVVADAGGRFTIGKALTTPDRIFLGLQAALTSAAARRNPGAAPPAPKSRASGRLLIDASPGARKT